MSFKVSRLLLENFESGCVGLMVFALICVMRISLRVRVMVNLAFIVLRLRSVYFLSSKGLVIVSVRRFIVLGKASFLIFR